MDWGFYVLYCGIASKADNTEGSLKTVADILKAEAGIVPRDNPGLGYVLFR